MAGEGDAERLVVLLEARIRDFERNMQKASGTAQRSFFEITAGSSRAARQIETDLSGASSRVAGIMGNFGKGLALGAAGAIGVTVLAEIPKVVREIVAEGAGLVDTANKVGMTTRSLQELRFAATQGGATIEDFDKALGVFAKGVGEASQGGGELAKVFEANGIAIRDSDGNIRSSADLLRDYADLIKRAGSEQERARLTAIAFGRSGDDLANVFRDGASGIDDAAAAANRLNIVIDDADLQKIADLDDQWDAFATTLETRTKSAVLEAVTWLDQLAARVQQFGAQLDQFRKEQAGEALSPGAMIGALAGDGKDPLAGPMAGATEALKKGLADSAPSWPGRDEWLGVAKPTVLPPSGGGGGGGGGRSSGRGSRSGGAGAARDERDAVKELISSLEEEIDLVGKSDVEREVSNNLRHAGAEATAQEKTRIEELTRTLADQQEAYGQNREAASEMQDVGKDALKGFISDLKAGKSAGEALEGVIDRISDKLIDMALDSVFSGKGGGGLSGFLGGLLGGGKGSLPSVAAAGTGALVGANARGTNNWRGGLTMVGEAGPELVNLPGGSQIVPNDILRQQARAAPKAAAPAAPAVVNFSVVNNARGVEIGRSENVNEHGQRDIRVTVNEAVADSIGQNGGQTFKALRARGMRPAVTRRGG